MKEMRSSLFAVFALVSLLAFALAPALSADSGPPPQDPLSLILEPSQDTLWLDGFVSLNIGQDTDWSYGVGGTFFLFNENLGVSADYAISPDASTENSHAVNIGLTARHAVTDTLDLYLTGAIGYEVGKMESLDDLEQDLGAAVCGTVRAGGRFAPFGNAPVALFADIGRTFTFSDEVEDHTTARLGLTFFW